MSKLLPVGRVHTGNRVSDDAQRLAQRTAQRLGECPFCTGVLKSAQAVTVAAKTYDHGLGRRPQGVLVLNATAATAMGIPTTQTVDVTRQISMTASAAATADLWFF